MGARNHVASGKHCRFETEGSVDEVQIVVDCLRNTDDRNRLVAALDFVCNVAGAAQGTVAADAEQDVDVQTHQRIDHRFCGLLTARASKDRATVFLNVIHVIRVKNLRRIAVIRIQSAVAIRNTENIAYTIIKPQHTDKAFNDVV